MKRTLLLCMAGIAFFHFRAMAQFDEVGAFFGITYYAGDLTERYIEPLEFNQAGGVYLRRKVTDRLNWRFQLMKGTLSGNDANASVESGLWKRNLNFKTDIYELAAIAEYQFFKIQKGGYGASPYAFGGVAALHFIPYADYDGTTYDLRHLRTEGVDYSATQIVIPFGAGLKLHLNDKAFFGVEAGFRKTFTDYLDDVSGSYPDNLTSETDFGTTNIRTKLSYRVPEINSSAPELPTAGSQRGNPDRNDWYTFFGLTIGLKLK